MASELVLLYAIRRAGRVSSDFAPFAVYLEYDGATYARHFSKEEVVKQIDMFEKSLSLESIPRVLRRENATAPMLPPLHSIAPKATPIPPGTFPPLNPLKSLTDPENTAMGTILSTKTPPDLAGGSH
jgi:hypothetical protein